MVRKSPAGAKLLFFSGTNLTSLNLHKNNITDQDKINILKLILFQKVKLKKINFKYRDYPPIVPDYSDTLYEIFRENLLEKCIVEWDICELEQSLVLEKNTSLKALSEPYLCGETLMEILSNINTTITEVKPKFATTNFQLSELVWANKGKKPTLLFFLFHIFFEILNFVGVGK